MKTLPTAISLCCGAGVAEYGIKKHFRTVLAIDFDANALETHRLNHPSVPILEGDIADPQDLKRALELVRSVDAIIAAPPCQVFSSANSTTAAARAASSRSALYLKAIDWVEKYQPLAYIAENVASVRRSWQFHAAIARLQRLGYRVTVFDLDSADFGTPQHRERVFLVAVRGDLPPPLRPTFTHGDEKMRATDPTLKPYVSLYDAIYDLFELELQAIAKGEDAHRQFLNEAMLGVAKLSARRAFYLSHVPAGGCWKDLPPEIKTMLLDELNKNDKSPFEGMAARFAWLTVPGTLRTSPSIKHWSMPIHPGVTRYSRPSWMETSATLMTEPANRALLIAPGVKIADNHLSDEKRLQQAGFWMRRPDWPNTSYSLTSNPDGDKSALISPGCNVFGGPCQALVGYPSGEMSRGRRSVVTRYLTVREYARIMGLPDSFVPASKSSTLGYRQIGNGIPPQLIGAVCQAVAKAIQGGDPAGSPINHKPAIEASSDFDPATNNPEKYAPLSAAPEAVANSVANDPQGPTVPQAAEEPSPETAEEYTPPEKIQPAVAAAKAKLDGGMEISEDAFFDAFSGLYDRAHQIAVVRSAISAAVESGFKDRFHTLLYGPPAAAKTQVLRTLRQLLGEERVLALDATSMTKPGAEKLLLEMATVPPFIFVEEVEKADERTLQFLLSVLDDRAEISKTNFKTSARRTVRSLCLATANDMEKLNRVLSGAIASRFAHKVYCPRPNRDVLRQILQREVVQNGGKEEWIQPALEYCTTVERTDDPRRIIAVCKSGRDALLTGEYQQHLKACRGSSCLPATAIDSAGQHDALFSSVNHKWRTPPEIYDPLHEEFGFTLDVCADHGAQKCQKYFSPDQDGLLQNWAPEKCFMNSPYGDDIPKWMAKAEEESQRGALVVALVPARTDTRWWRNYATKGAIRFVPGRVRFLNADGQRQGPAPFPSAIVIFKPPTFRRPGDAGGPK